MAARLNDRTIPWDRWNDELTCDDKQEVAAEEAARPRVTRGSGWRWPTPRKRRTPKGPAGARRKERGGMSVIAEAGEGELGLHRTAGSRPAPRPEGQGPETSRANSPA